jgi:hypothetical protein
MGSEKNPRDWAGFVSSGQTPSGGLEGEKKRPGRSRARKTRSDPGQLPESFCAEARACRPQWSLKADGVRDFLS